MTGKEKTHPEVAREKCQKIIEEMKNQSPKFDLKDNLHQLPGSFWFLLYKKK